MKRILLCISVFMLCVLGGCSSKSEETLKVGIIRVPNDTTVAIQQGYFEDAFKDYGIKLEFVFFDSGVAMNQAFASGSLDFAEMGYTNAVVALSKSLDVRLFWIHDVIGKSEALVVNDPSIKSVEDLRGKKVATVFSSTAHYSLLKTLEEAGMSAKDLTLLNMETAEIVAAWQRQDLDAAYTWEPTLSKIQTGDNTLVTSEDLANKGSMTTNVGLVRNKIADEHPEYVVSFIEALDRAYTLHKEDPQAAVESAASYLEITNETAQEQIQGSKWLDVRTMISQSYMGDNGAFVNTFKETMHFWHEQGFIDGVPSDEEIRTFIDPQFVMKFIENKYE